MKTWLVTRINIAVTLSDLTIHFGDGAQRSLTQYRIKPVYSANGISDSVLFNLSGEFVIQALHNAGPHTTLRVSVMDCYFKQGVLEQ